MLFSGDEATANSEATSGRCEASRGAYRFEKARLGGGS